MKELEKMDMNELIHLKQDIDHRLWRMGHDDKHTIEKSLVDISEALRSIDTTFKRMEDREKGIQISGRYKWNDISDSYVRTPPTNNTNIVEDFFSTIQYDWSKEEDL